MVNPRDISGNEEEEEDEEGGLRERSLVSLKANAIQLGHLLGPKINHLVCITKMTGKPLVPLRYRDLEKKANVWWDP